MIIGVTGGIGSGKSTILRAVAQQGYAVYDCDKEAKRIIMEDAEVRKQMVELFGEGVYADGVYQTSYVAAQVFVYPEKLQQLNAIVHPAVTRDIAHWLTDKKVAFIESAILITAGIDAFCDKVVAVIAPEKVRIQRVLQRAEQQHHPLKEEEVRLRIRAQRGDYKSATIKLNNDGRRSIEDLAQELIGYATSQLAE